jgi:tRNA threonylcarbamoyladenosine biosynthesis protein TsaB
MPAIGEMLTQQQITKEQVDAFVVVSGPGSFTGLRVGIATVKGLCEVLQKPLMAVSMLEAVAIARGGNARQLTVALDAGRSELYVGDFVVENSRASLVREYIAKVESLVVGSAHGDGARGANLLTTDAKVANAFEALGVSVQQFAPVQADEVARIGLSKFLRGEFADPATLDANYIRRSDAEIFSMPKA